MNEHLPASVRLPGGYVVTIKTYMPSTLRRKAGSDVFGYWDVKTRTVCIDKSVTVRKQRYLLTHELDHAYNDWRHWYLGEEDAASGQRSGRG